MSELMKKIYEEVIQHERAAVETVKRVDAWVDKLAAPYKQRLDAEQSELLRDLMYSAAVKAEEEGFQLGIRIMAELMLEMLAGS